MQEAVGRALALAHEPFEGSASYYAWLIAEYTRKREILYRGLRAAGLPPVETEGSFFIMADTSAIQVPDKYLYPNGRDAPPAPRDYAFCRFLTTEIGVAAIPVCGAHFQVLVCAQVSRLRSFSVVAGPLSQAPSCRTRTSIMLQTMRALPFAKKTRR